MQCIGCGNCVIVCPVSASRDYLVSGGSGPRTEMVTLAIENGFARWRRLELCEECGTCFDVCATGAIRELNASRSLTRAAWIRARKRYCD